MKVIAIDQSLSRFGISVAENGKLLRCQSYTYKKSMSKSAKRLFLGETVADWAEKWQPDRIIVERVRTFSQGFLSTQTIIALGSLVTTIIDHVPEDLPTFSADTRAWKARVLGNAKASKQDAVNHVAQFGFQVDHDAADSGCMALYAFHREARLKREE